MFTWSSFFLVILIFSFPRPSIPKPKLRLFLRDQIFRNLNFFRRPNSLKLKPLLFSETKISKTKTETFFRDQILRKRYRNPPKIGKSCEIVFKYFPPSPSLFFFFSRKKDIYFSEYFPPLSSPFFFSLGIEHQRKRSSLFFPLSNRLE